MSGLARAISQRAAPWLVPLGLLAAWEIAADTGML